MEKRTGLIGYPQWQRFVCSVCDYDKDIYNGSDSEDSGVHTCNGCGTKFNLGAVKYIEGRLVMEAGVKYYACINCGKRIEDFKVKTLCEECRIRNRNLRIEEALRQKANAEKELAELKEAPIPPAPKDADILGD